MFAVISEHGTLVFGDGVMPSDAVEVPEAFLDLVSIPDRLVWVGTRIEDAASINRWFVAPDGTRRAYQGGDDWVEAAGRWDSPLYRKPDGSWAILNAEETKRQALRAYAARRRYRKETASVEIGGLRVPTDERTQSVLAGAYARARADASYAIAKWKVGPSQYVALSNGEIIAIGEAVADHIQRCFDRNAEVDDLIDSDEVTTTTQVDALFDAP